MDWRSALRPPRKLRFTREGRFLVVIALAVGFAAINTGHNLLYFGWGLVLSAIVTSGVLSEATLWALGIRPRRPEELRAGALSPLPIVVENPQKRLPALAVELELDVVGAGGRRSLAAPYLLRVAPREELLLLVPWVPERRGVYVVEGARARTTYPFGFFEKLRRFSFARPLEVVVFPERKELGPIARTLLSRLGELPSGRRGAGDELFSLRPYETGDDPRRIAWRRSAKSGRLVSKEMEAYGTRQVVLELMFPQVKEVSALPSGVVENALAALGSLAEDLLSSGSAVGLFTAGVALAPGSGSRQRAAILEALARLSPAAPLPERTSAREHAARVALAVPGWPVPLGVDHVVDLELLRRVA